MLALIQQLGINLIGDDHKIVFHRNRSDLFQAFQRHHSPGRIAWKIQQKHLGPRCDLPAQHGRIERKSVFDFRLNRNRNAVRHPHFRRVGDETGFRIQHLVTGVEERPHGDIERFTDADGDDAFIFGTVRNVIIVAHITADFPAQRRRSKIRSIAGMTFFQRKNTGFPDGPRRHEIRLADTETDHIVHRIDEIEKAPDSAFRKRFDMVGDKPFTDTL